MLFIGYDPRNETAKPISLVAPGMLVQVDRELVGSRHGESMAVITSSPGGAVGPRHATRRFICQNIVSDRPA